MRWEFHNDAPIYAQVMERVERMIVSGALPPGAKLPSVRTFALEAGDAAVLTLAQGYSILSEDSVNWGKVTIEAAGEEVTIGQGETVLIPASADDLCLVPDACMKVLTSFIPDL